MNAIGFIALVGFLGAWISAVVTWVIAAYSLFRFLPKRNPEHGWRAFKFGGIFCLCGLCLMGVWAGR
jgi:O-antigen/teichoic acid export membrane protein